MRSNVDLPERFGPQQRMGFAPHHAAHTTRGAVPYSQSNAPTRLTHKPGTPPEHDHRILPIRSSIQSRLAVVALQGFLVQPWYFSAASLCPELCCQFRHMPWA